MRQQPPRTPQKPTKQVYPWRIVEGDPTTIAKIIQKALEQIGEKQLTVEFRIFRSEQ